MNHDAQMAWARSAVMEIKRPGQSCVGGGVDRALFSIRCEGEGAKAGTSFLAGLTLRLVQNRAGPVPVPFCCGGWEVLLRRPFTQVISTTQ